MRIFYFDSIRFDCQLKLKAAAFAFELNCKTKSVLKHQSRHVLNVCVLALESIDWFNQLDEIWYDSNPQIWLIDFYLIKLHRTNRISSSRIQMDFDIKIALPQLIHSVYYSLKCVLTRHKKWFFNNKKRIDLFSHLFEMYWYTIWYIQSCVWVTSLVWLDKHTPHTICVSK